MNYADLGFDSFIMRQLRLLNGAMLEGETAFVDGSLRLSSLTTQIGRDDEVFKVGPNGLQLGSRTFANAEFSVTPAGVVTATGLKITIVMTAGATINGATLPVPVYQETSDSEVYACDANDLTKLKFIGFAVSNGTDGNSITVQTVGKVTGFTGLTTGARYYVQDAVGTVESSKGTYAVLVGQAVSTTEIEIFSESQEGLKIELVASDNLKASADTERVSTSDTYEKKKEITVKIAGAIRVKFDLAQANGGTAFGQINVNGVVVGTERSTTGTTFTTYSEDISGLVAYDEVQIYLKRTGVGVESHVKNFRLYWDKVATDDYSVVTD